jgi:hypothetical protein
MVIDQRNAGASVTPATATATYTIDRYFINLDTATTRTTQQVTVAPEGFNYSFKVTNTTGANAASGDQNIIQQSIEGYNVADLGWGTANAKPITISFWVQSSLTGTYGVGLSNSAANRCFVSTYTINTANTWEYKTITVAGDTTGTWLTTNGLGLRVRFDLGSGSALQVASNVWGSSFGNTVSGRANWIGTSGATFYITGVQLEKGTAASPFEYRLYGTELALCQRYYYKLNGYTLGYSYANSLCPGVVALNIAMRAAPSVDSGAAYTVQLGSAGTPAYSVSTPQSIHFFNSSANWSLYVYVLLTAGLNSEL